MPSGIPAFSRPVDIDRDWTLKAACNGLDPEIFFPTKSGMAPVLVRQAKTICARCEVECECLAYALKNNIRHGVWGGSSEQERLRMRRAMRLSDD